MDCDFPEPSWGGSTQQGHGSIAVSYVDVCAIDRHRTEAVVELWLSKAVRAAIDSPPWRIAFQSRLFSWCPRSPSWIIAFDVKQPRTIHEEPRTAVLTAGRNVYHINTADESPITRAPLLCERLRKLRCERLRRARVADDRNRSACALQVKLAPVRALHVALDAERLLRRQLRASSDRLVTEVPKSRGSRGLPSPAPGVAGAGGGRDEEICRGAGIGLSGMGTRLARGARFCIRFVSNAFYKFAAAAR